MMRRNTGNITDIIVVVSGKHDHPHWLPVSFPTWYTIRGTLAESRGEEDSERSHHGEQYGARSNRYQGLEVEAGTRGRG